MAGDFPFYGDFVTEPADAVARLRRGEPVAILEETLANQYGVKPGDSVKLGRSVLTVAGALRKLAGESAAVATLAPRALIPLRALPAAGLTGPGSLVRHRVALRLPPGTDPEAVGEALRRKFPEERFGVETAASRERELRPRADQRLSFSEPCGLHCPPARRHRRRKRNPRPRAPEASHGRRPALPRRQRRASPLRSTWCRGSASGCSWRGRGGGPRRGAPAGAAGRPQGLAAFPGGFLHRLAGGGPRHGGGVHHLHPVHPPAAPRRAARLAADGAALRRGRARRPRLPLDPWRLAPASDRSPWSWWPASPISRCAELRAPGRRLCRRPRGRAGGPGGPGAGGGLGGPPLGRRAGCPTAIRPGHRQPPPAEQPHGAPARLPGPRDFPDPHPLPGALDAPRRNRGGRRRRPAQPALLRHPGRPDRAAGPDRGRGGLPRPGAGAGRDDEALLAAGTAGGGSPEGPGRPPAGLGAPARIPLDLPRRPLGHRAGGAGGNSSAAPGRRPDPRRPFPSRRGLRPATST